jgi:SAM-dependent methyltransferase
MNVAQDAYLLANGASELERLQVQSRVWEPAGRALLERIPRPQQARVLDCGCGVLGWLRILSEWVGSDGTVVGTDINGKMLAGARDSCAGSVGNVELLEDDLFASHLPAASFDLVHARFQIAPLGRAAEQVAAYRRWLKPGGWLVLEDPDMASCRINPDGVGFHELVHLIERAFLAAGGNINAGRALPNYFRALGAEPTVLAQVVALPPGHPYLHLPLKFAAALRPRLERLVGESALERLLTRVDADLARPGVWGTTFTLIQAYGQLP